MSNCCATRRAIQSVKPNELCKPGTCSFCGEPGKAVDIITLKSLLAPDAMRRLDPSTAYYFCRTADCPVAYFDSIVFFTKDELTVRVYQKETSEPLLVCYCFGFTRENIFDEIARTGKSTTVQEISQHIKDGKCACEIRNPQGSCCLGNIRQVVKQAQPVR